jgi:enediyne biosynthesis protein E4
MNTPLLGAALWTTIATSAFAGPRITLQPSPAANVVSIGANLTNRITATTTNAPLSYQWMFNEVALPDATHETLILTNLQLSQAGSYRCTLTDLSGSTNSNPWVVAVDAQFTKTSDPALSAGSCTGIAWGDYNNDGFVDLFVSPFNRASLLHSNNGDGTFTRILGGSITTDSGSTFGACWGDYDNDGWLDLFVGVNNQGNDWLYRNNGDATFTKITSGAIVNSGANANNCTWGDYDNDGWIDLFVANSDQNDFLFHNNSGGTFARITTNSIALKPGNSQGGSWGDYDNDGLADLFVSRAGGPNLLYHNLGGGAFFSVTNDPIVTDVSAGGQGTSWGDYDNDGHLDMFVTNPGRKSFLYHNHGDGSFVKITNGPVANDIGDSSSGAWGDYDNDGALDLFVANRSGFDFLYRNNGDGTFARMTNTVLATDPAVSFSGAWADYDNNGFLDLFVTRFRTYNNALYHNAGNSNAWIILKCEGRLSNRAAIGAKVRVKAIIAGREVWQLREISGGGGLGAQPDLRMHFGLGDATKVETIRIEWPGGIVREMHDVAPRQLLTIIEPEARITPALLELPAGATALFTVGTTLSPPTQFQWRLNGMELSGETNTTLVITNTETKHAGRYTVTVSKPDLGLSFNTPAALLTGPVMITQQPRSVNVRPSSNAVFSVVAIGIGAVTYQWRFNGVILSDETNAVLVVANAQSPHSGSYDVVVANSYGSVFSQPVSLGILVNPAITVQPLSQSVVVGGNVTLSVAGTGSPAPFTFEWRRGPVVFWTNIVNEPVSFLTLTNVQPEGAGNYRVVIKNAANPTPGLISSNAVVTVLADSDGDRLPDEWELMHFADLAQIPEGDFDGDGFKNWSEYLSGTDPGDATSLLRIVQIQGMAGSMRIDWQGGTNGSQVLQRRFGFGEADETWLDVFTNRPSVPGAPGTYVDLDATNATKVYRIRVKYP